MKNIVKIFGLGFALMIVWQLCYFLLSFVYPDERAIDFLSANIITAIVLMFFAWGFGQRLRYETPAQGLIIGCAWVIIVALILVIIGIGNDTLGTIFGTWSSYLGYVGIILGAYIARRRTIRIPPPGF